jgi:hypothetical protein
MTRLTFAIAFFCGLNTCLLAEANPTNRQDGNYFSAAFNYDKEGAYMTFNPDLAWQYTSSTVIEEDFRPIALHKTIDKLEPQRHCLLVNKQPSDHL